MSALAAVDVVVAAVVVAAEPLRTEPDVDTTTFDATTAPVEEEKATTIVKVVETA